MILFSEFLDPLLEDLTFYELGPIGVGVSFTTGDPFGD